MALDKNTEKKTEVRWARLLIKMEGKSRPSVVNILEGPRSFELQIWWEISPWVTGVYPVSSREEAKNSEKEDDGEARAVKRLSFPGPKSNLVGQWEQAREEKLGQKLAHVVTDALMNGKGGAHSDARWYNQEGLRVLEVEPIQQAVSSFLPGLNEAEIIGPRDKFGKRSVVIKAGSGPKKGSKWQQFGARNISTDGAVS